jgi:hypothetical protein
MYGGTFKQNFGWYINKQSFELGVDPRLWRAIPGLCIREILVMYIVDPIEEFRRAQEIGITDQEKSRLIIKEVDRQSRRIRNFVENQVRAKFGHKKIGEAWTSETILLQIVKSLFPNYSVFRHHRPDFLEGLELDIFIEELSLGSEYQGIQHYKPVDHWGGPEALAELKKRDRRKKRLCEKNGVRLVYFRFHDSLDRDFVYSQLQQYIEK